MAEEKEEEINKIIEVKKEEKKDLIKCEFCNL